MAGTEANSINASTQGIVGNTGTSFTGSTTTQYNVLVGGSTSSTLSNVAPSATSGIPLISQGASADPAFSTALVVGGGTGSTSFTAYSVICGGTTGTGNLQNVSGVGSSGQVLTSNGAGTLPTWQAASVASFVTKNTVFTSSGTYTPSAGMVFCQIICLGGGGAGGGASSTVGGNSSGGAGGSAGEYAVGIFPSGTIGSSQIVTIGAAGIGSTGSAGGNGGNTSVGAIISAFGGNGGGFFNTGNPTYFVNPSSGGTGGSGGDYRFQGSYGAGSNNLFGLSGFGANSSLGGGGYAVTNATGGGSTGHIAGVNATGYGAGGSGGYSSNVAGTVAGGNGTAGIVIIQEFIT